MTTKYRQIKVRIGTAEELKMLKIHPRQSNDEVIRLGIELIKKRNRRLVKENKKEEQEETLP